MPKDYRKEWNDRAKKLLVGKKIVKVGYLLKEETEGLGWMHSSLAIELDDGTVIWPSRDDEGNDAGALFTTSDDLQTIPVIPA